MDGKVLTSYKPKIAKNYIFIMYFESNTVIDLFFSILNLQFKLANIFKKIFICRAGVGIVMFAAYYLRSSKCIYVMKMLHQSNKLFVARSPEHESAPEPQTKNKNIDQKH